MEPGCRWQENILGVSFDKGDFIGPAPIVLGNLWLCREGKMLFSISKFHHRQWSACYLSGAKYCLQHVSGESKLDQVFRLWISYQHELVLPLSFWFSTVFIAIYHALRPCTSFTRYTLACVPDLQFYWRVKFLPQVVICWESLFVVTTRGSASTEGESSKWACAESG